MSRAADRSAFPRSEKGLRMAVPPAQDIAATFGGTSNAGSLERTAADEGGGT
jgi:hypothetical protein